jgi:hypothetical protein
MYIVTSSSTLGHITRANLYYAVRRLGHMIVLSIYSTHCRGPLAERECKAYLFTICKLQNITRCYFAHLFIYVVVPSAQHENDRCEVLFIADQ